MIEIKHFKKHLNNIPLKDWKLLFDLLPEIKSTETFGELIESKKLKDGSYTFPYWNSAKIVDKTVETLDNLYLTPNFDWMDWDEGRKILSNEQYDFSSLDKVTLCKLLTCIIRLARFSEGHLVQKFQDRTVEKILESLETKVKDSVQNSEKKQNSFLKLLKFFKIQK